MLQSSRERVESMECDYPDCANRISRRCHHCGGSYCVRHITLEAYGQNICDLCAIKRAKQFTRIRKTVALVVICIGAFILLLMLCAIMTGNF